ncbi:MAG: carbohydrate binding family 9 domain-containing protein, partial [Acidobacteria bacterium]|nr:carbohydrate binding family 9 domain-containing protein [Acidobacteriota bacterium]
RPELIRARFSDRDSAFNDDFVGFALDTFNDQRRAFEFFVNPVGVQMDLTKNEMTGNEDDSWDAIWDSAGSITAEGYQVEIRIPFSSLRFPRVSGEMTWGIDALRYYPREQQYRFGLNPMKRGANCYLCQASKLVGFEGVSPARSIEIDPTLTSSMSGIRTDFPDGKIEDGDPDTEFGVTGRWGITPNLMLGGTINPDFSQVEADVAQLDINTQFALFYPEKRPFFLEGADLFDTRINAMYSRNIAEPEWGVKLTGKMGKDAVGAIVAQDRRTNFLLPSSQSSSVASLDEENVSTILRYRRDLTETTTGGVFFTSREGDEFHNRLVGGDILFRWKQTEALRVELLGSQTKDHESIAELTGRGAEERSGHAIRAVYQHTSRNWMTYLFYRDVAEDFRADLGFVPRSDFRQFGAALERGWYPETGGWSQFRIGVEANDTEDQGGQHLDRQVNAYARAQGPRQSSFRLDLISADQFFGGELFDRDRIRISGEMQLHPDAFLSLEAIGGNQVDFANARQGEMLRFEPGLRLNLGKHLRLNLNHTYETLDVDQGQLFTAALTQVQATYQFNVRTFVRWIGQHLDVDRDPALYTSAVPAASEDIFNQFLFSYKINPLTVLFLGYSDTYVGTQEIDLTQQSRTFFFKVGYAFML